MALSPGAFDAAHVVDHDRDDRHQQDDRQGAGAPVVPEGEHLPVHAVGDHFGLELTVGHDEDDIEHLEDHDQHGRRDGDQSASDGRDDDLEEDTDLAGAIDPSRLQQFGGDALDGGRQDDHGESREDPDHDHDQKEVVPGLQNQPALGISAQPGVDGVQQADLRPLNRLEAVHELPDHRRAHGRDRHRKEDHGLGHRFPAPDAVDQHGDDQPDRDDEARDEDQPQDVVAQSQQQFRGGEGKEVGGGAEEGLRAGVHEAEVDRAQGWIDQVGAQDDQGRADKHERSHGLPHAIGQDRDQIVGDQVENPYAA